MAHSGSPWKEKKQKTKQNERKTKSSPSVNSSHNLKNVPMFQGNLWEKMLVRRPTSLSSSALFNMNGLA